MANIPSWDELLESMNSAAQHPADTAWNIYRYLNQHYKELGSTESRILLNSYLKMRLERPSLIHSCILSVALKMCDVYDDFRLPAFLQVWGYPQCLRPEDRERQTNAQGRSFLSLAERTERVLNHYLLHHAAERQPSASPEAILPMVAVKVFETESNGRKRKSVKLVGPRGEELLADSHAFPCKPWEIVGNLFDVLVRHSKEGNPRAEEVVVSQKSVSDAFPPIVGYVDRFDGQHGHFHIFDSLSRHFVAENPRLKPTVGGFVMFSPIVPAVDKFKSAVVTQLLTPDQGQQAFGLLPASVSYVNAEKGYFYYKLTDNPPTTPEGTITLEGSAQLSLSPASLRVGQLVRLLLFLKRGKDGAKHNYVVSILPL